MNRPGTPDIAYGPGLEAESVQDMILQPMTLSEAASFAMLDMLGVDFFQVPGENFKASRPEPTMSAGSTLLDAKVRMRRGSIYTRQ